MATVTWQGDDVTNPTLWKTAANWDTGNVPTNLGPRQDRP